MIAGIHSDISIDAYVADPCPEPSLSASIASILVNRSPAHAYAAHPRLTPSPKAEWSAAANFGSAVHSLVFGGPKVQRYGYADWRKKEAQEDRANCLKGGEIPLLLHEYDEAKKIATATAFTLEKIVGDYRGLEMERTVIWQEGKAWCRVRPDAMTPDRRTVVDLKVTGVDLGNGGANRQFFNQGYDMQAAFLERGLDAHDPDGAGKRWIIYLFVEREAPHAALPVLVSESTLMIARKKFNAALNLWRECTTSKRWPAYPLELTSSVMPGWQEQAWLARELAGDVNVEGA